jgi:hypothetical protein
MPTKPIAILFGAVALQFVGCGHSNTPVSNPVPTSQPSGVGQNAFYDFDDPRCSPAQRQAIRAATKAVVGTATPASNALPFLHYQLSQDNDGWSVSVWHYGPGQPPMPGGFTDVQFDKDFQVRAVMGGA